MLCASALSAVYVCLQFENTETSFYRRVRISVVLDNDSVAQEKTDAWVYVRHEECGGPAWAKEWTVCRLVKEPMISCYDEELAKTYLARDKR
jgi:hypothetical protein